MLLCPERASRMKTNNNFRDENWEGKKKKKIHNNNDNDVGEQRRSVRRLINARGDSLCARTRPFVRTITLIRIKVRCFTVPREVLY